MMTKNLMRLATGAVVLALGSAGCDSLLDVSDPQRYTSEDLDGALAAVASGVEGDLFSTMDEYVIQTELLGDVYQHTGTWAQYDDVDHGRFTYANQPNVDAVYNTLMRVQWFAEDAEERFARVLGEAEAASSPLTAQVRSAGAISRVLVGQAFCEAPVDPSGEAVSDQQVLERAVTALTDAIATAQAAGATEWVTVNTAMRARAHLLLGQYDLALADAQQIPDGFEKLSLFSDNSGRQNNSLVTLTTRDFNRAAGVREKWWHLVDQDVVGLRDPYTDELDARVPIWYDGTIGVDGVTPHYSQWKYQERGSDIPLVDSEEMRLIEAEVYWRRGELGQAMDRINALRTAAGLTPHAATMDSDLVFEYLLHERFAETFMEGIRASDLARLGLTRDVFAAMNDPERPASRPIKFAIADDEAINNANIEDDAQQRCLPKS